jgi:hypothetical protein
MVYNKYDQNQLYTLAEAKRLAHEGSEFSHLVSLLNPDFALRLKIFVQSLPKDIAERTIYGKAHWKEQSEAKQRKRS